MNKVDMRALKVLVIDDEVFIRKMIIRVLNDLGVKAVFDTSNGEDGMQKMKESGKDLDIVLCDLEMPSMNGLAFVKQLRASPNSFNPKIPVLIVSGHSEDESVRKVAELGINGFLVKPISKKDLENRIKASVGNPMTDSTKLKT